MLKLNERLQAARGYARKFQKDLSEQLKKSIASISSYESGQVEPSVDELKIAAELYGVSAVWLVLGEGEMLASNTSAINSLSLESKALS